MCPRLSTLLAVGQAVLASLMALVFVVNVLRDGLAGTLVKLTNWSWLAQTVLYAATLPAPSRAGDEFTRAALCLCYVPVGVLVLGVLVQISVLLLDEHRLVERWQQDGISVGAIVVGSDFLHWLPALIYAGYTATHWANIVDAWRVWANEPLFTANRSATRVFFALYQLTGAFVLLAAYLAAVNPDVEYLSNESIGVGFAVFGAVDVLYVGTALALFFCYGNSEPPLVSKEPLAPPPPFNVNALRFTATSRDSAVSSRETGTSHRRSPAASARPC